MAIQTLLLDQSGLQPHRKPFLEDYLSSLTKTARKAVLNSVCDVDKISLSMKGMIVTTECFSLFFWKKSQTYDFLREAVETWSEESKEVPTLMIKVLDTDGSHEICVDTDRPTRWFELKAGKLYGTTVEDARPVSQSNPFLVALAEK